MNNIALVPASLLPLTARWQAIARDLSQGEMLIVVPWQSKQRHVIHSVASYLRAKGMRVKVMNSEEH